MFPIQQFQQTDTPFYYYDLGLLNETLRTIRDAVSEHPHFHVHYAVKANANPRILQIIAQAGLGADCVSGGEVEAAAAAGFPAESIVYAGVGKSDREIKAALRVGISCFNVESLPELEVINELAQAAGQRVRIAFRVNPNVDAHTHAKITTGLNENKFGINAEQLVDAIRHAQTLPAVEYAGLHFHIGSQITELAPFAELCHRVNEIQDELEAQGITTPSINVGGGLGIDYDAPDAHPVPDFRAYFQTFADHLRLREGQPLHFELGRSVVAQCGSLIARVLYVKEGTTKRFLIVDAGFTELIRPAMYDAHHFTQNLTADAKAQNLAADGQNITADADAQNQATAVPQLKYDVVGPICESSDVFSTDELLPLSHRGDLIAFRSAGAYGEVMASTYNCRTLPHSVFSEAGE